MEKYCALDIKKIYNSEETVVTGDCPTCWLLYQTSMENGVSIRMKCSVGPLLKLTHVIPESLHLIRYEAGEYYYMENLLEEVEHNCIDLNRILEKRRIYLEESLEESELSLENMGVGRVWSTPKAAEFSEIVANNNGFCVIGPLKKKAYGINGHWSEEKRRLIEVCYRPNTKKLNKSVIDQITCYVVEDQSDFDCKQYLANTLEDEQMQLSQEDSLELYRTLHGHADRFIIDGGETTIFRRDRFEEGYFVHEGKVKYIKESSPQVLYEAWTKGRLQKVLNSAIVLGLLVEVDFKDF